MRILFTGGSSFTGSWFIKELAKAGHHILSVLTKGRDDYSGIRKRRVEKILDLCEPYFNCSFGSDSFLKLIRSKKNIDIFCHHAAEVTNHKSPDFDVLTAVSHNTFKLPLVLNELRKKSCEKIVLTGTVFEPDEGIGSLPLTAFSPYGLSKGITYEIFKYHAKLEKIHFRKFVIPNPFGPYEEKKFTTYLAKTWLKKETAQVKTPLYVRDNIHITLLAKTYAWFVAQTEKTSIGISSLHPSGYPESQGNFTFRMANELKKRWGLPCDVEFHKQSSFPEPKVRINYDILDQSQLGWEEERAWDDLAEFYKTFLR